MTRGPTSAKWTTQVLGVKESTEGGRSLKGKRGLVAHTRLKFLGQFLEVQSTPTKWVVSIPGNPSGQG